MCRGGRLFLPVTQENLSWNTDLKLSWDFVTEIGVCGGGGGGVMSQPQLKEETEQLPQEDQQSKIRHMVKQHSCTLETNHMVFKDFGEGTSAFTLHNHV